MLLFTWSITYAPAAKGQQPLASVDQSKKLYCRYRDPKTFNESTGWVPGLKSCDEGDSAAQVAYQPCFEKKTMPVRRGDLTGSEPGCEGVHPQIGVYAAINAKIVDIKGNDLVVAYPTASGPQTFALKKDNLKGVKPERDGEIVFFSPDLAKHTDPDALAKNFEKFRLEASKGGFMTGPQSVVGVITK
jgi:hypothetical protein